MSGSNIANQGQEINGLAILLLIGVFVWAGFNIHERLGWVLIAQVPPLLMMGIRKCFRGVKS